MSTPITTISSLQKERLSYIFLNYGRLDVKDGAFVLEDANGTRVQMPVSSFNVIFLEPGTSVTHAAAWLAAQVHTLICFVGEAANRSYSFGRPSQGSVQNLLKQVRAYANEDARLKVIRHMYSIRFGEELPSRRSLEQLRGIEGARVREAYKRLARAAGVPWTGRCYDQSDWDSADPLNRAISAATAAMHGVCEAVVTAYGFNPAIGFIHHGGLRSFVFDIADLYKMEVCVPLAFNTVKVGTHQVETRVRHQLRDHFRKSRLVSRILNDLDLLFPDEEHPPQ